MLNTKDTRGIYVTKTKVATSLQVAIFFPSTDKKMKINDISCFTNEAMMSA